LYHHLSFGVGLLGMESCPRAPGKICRRGVVRIASPAFAGVTTNHWQVSGHGSQRHRQSLRREPAPVVLFSRSAARIFFSGKHCETKSSRSTQGSNSSRLFWRRPPIVLPTSVSRVQAAADLCDSRRIGELAG